MWQKMKRGQLMNVIKNRKGGSVLDYAVAVGGALVLGVILYNVAGDTVKPKLESMVPSLIQGEQVEVTAGGESSTGSLTEELEKGLQQDREKGSSDSQMAPALSPDQKIGKSGGSQGTLPLAGIFAEKSLRETVEGQLVALNKEGILESGMMVLKESKGVDSQLAGIAFVDEKKGQIASSSIDSTPRKKLIGEKNLFFHLPGQFVEIVEVKDFKKKNLKRRIIKIRHPIKKPIKKLPPKVTLPVEPPRPPGHIYLPVQPVKPDDKLYILPIEPK